MPDPKIVILTFVTTFVVYIFSEAVINAGRSGWWFFPAWMFLVGFGYNLRRM